MWYTLIAVVIGFLLDLILGDPAYPFHPVRLMGHLIKFMEKRIRALFPKSKKGEFVAGILLVILVCGTSCLITILGLRILYNVHPILGLVVESLLCYQLLATKSLRDESMKVYTPFIQGDLEQGRIAVSWIVGRDTDQLTEEGVIKATVETIAENTSDGVIAPLLFMMMGGAAAGVFYKAVNTMDSMVGYKNEKYLYFGRAAARLDDICNYIPARLAAYCMMAATLFQKETSSLKKMFTIYRRDRRCHASPNSAQTEAVMAGALGVQLAGDAFYFGTCYQKQTIGDATREIEVIDIKRANALLYKTAFLGLILFGGVRICINMVVILIS